MAYYTDQTGHTISLNQPPKRIISLVPSQTELLFDLDLEKEVVGITKFCIHPNHWFRTKTRIGGTKNIHSSTIAALAPDLILANKEENVQEQVASLSAIAPVWVSDIHDLPSALSMISTIGKMVNREEKAALLIQQIQNGFDQLSDSMVADSLPPMATAYLIWREPYMTVGSDTFIHDMMQRTGLVNAFASQQRYPVTSIEELQQKNIRLLLLSSEPYPFSEKHMAALQHALPEAKILLVDGAMFSWYGSRLLHAAAYFCRLREAINKQLMTAKS